MRHSDFLRLHLMGASHRELFLLAQNSDFVSAVRRLRMLRPGISFEDSEARFEAVWKTLSKMGVSIISALDDGYPEEFLKLPRRPFLLYVKGSLPVSVPAISIVWSRKPSSYGISAVRKFVADFVSRGVRVISGGAYGIDAEAHRSTIGSNGITYAFIGTGIDIDYPRSNAGLFQEIVESWGGVISPFPPGSAPQSYHFPIRNALVAAYSAWTLVIEAAKNSGSLITARFALDFGKEVFAVPGDVFRPGSEGTNALIRDSSAKCVLSASDVLEELSNDFMSLLRKHAINSEGFSSGRFFQEDSSRNPDFLLDQAILQELSNGRTAHAESLSQSLGIDLPQILSRLSFLEISGRVGSDFSGSYFLESSAFG